MASEKLKEHFIGATFYIICLSIIFGPAYYMVNDSQPKRIPGGNLEIYTNYLSLINEEQSKGFLVPEFPSYGFMIDIKGCVLTSNEREKVNKILSLSDEIYQIGMRYRALNTVHEGGTGYPAGTRERIDELEVAKKEKFKQIKTLLSELIIDTEKEMGLAKK